MKKMMTLMLGLSLLGGTVAAFAQDAPQKDDTKDKKSKTRRANNSHRRTNNKERHVNKKTKEDPPKK